MGWELRHQVEADTIALYLSVASRQRTRITNTAMRQSKEEIVSTAARPQNQDGLDQNPVVDVS